MNSIIGIEKDLVSELGFVLVHDGQHNPGRFPDKPEEIRHFIRRYRRGDLEVIVSHDLRGGRGDIVRLEWSHGKSRERFREGGRPHKNSRVFFTSEVS
jgi:hypothetical protein